MKVYTDPNRLRATDPGTIESSITGTGCDPVTLTFLLAYLFFNDGIQTVIASASTFGIEELGFETGTVLDSEICAGTIGSDPRTLINVNGSIGRGSGMVDLNAIPASAIERIAIHEKTLWMLRATTACAFRDSAGQSDGTSRGTTP